MPEILLTLFINMTSNNDAKLKLICEYLRSIGHPITYTNVTCNKEISLIFRLPNHNDYDKFKIFLTQLAEIDSATQIKALLQIFNQATADKQTSDDRIVFCLSIPKTQMLPLSKSIDEDTRGLITLLIKNYQFDMSYASVSIHAIPAIPSVYPVGLFTQSECMGRDSELQTIEKHISSPVLIVGGPGTGKTALAKQFALRYTAVFLIHVDTDKDKTKNGNHILIQFKTLALHLGIHLDNFPEKTSNLLALIYQELNKTHAPYLIIFDGVSNHQDINGFLPTSDSPCCGVIITSRNCNSRDFGWSYKTTVLKNLALQDAKTYVKNSLLKSTTLLPFQESDIQSLCVESGCNPLALSQAIEAITTAGSVQSVNPIDCLTSKFNSLRNIITRSYEQIAETNASAFKTLKVFALISAILNSSEVSSRWLMYLFDENLMESFSHQSLLRQHGLIHNSESSPRNICISKPVSTIVLSQVAPEERQELKQKIEDTVKFFEPALFTFFVCATHEMNNRGQQVSHSSLSRAPK